MSTNTPPRKYGYTLPSLGGEGMEATLATDLFWTTDTESWELVGKYASTKFWPYVYYIRPINVGPEHELVGEDECGYLLTGNGMAHAPHDPQSGYLWEGTHNGVRWLSIVNSNASRRSPILAIRRRKVVKDEYPKYWQGLFVYRQISQSSHLEYYQGHEWKRCSNNEVLASMKPITPQRAFELTGDKEILEKGGDEKCSAIVANASNKCPEEQQQSQTAQSMVSHTQSSPAPEVTKGASNTCQYCNKDIGNSLWGFCSPECLKKLVPNPVDEAVQKALQSSPPQWIPVSERLPRDGEHFILGYRLSENWVTSDNFYWPLDIAHSPWTHWHPLAVPPPPPRPKTREQEDEEWIDNQFAASGVRTNCEHEVKALMLAALAYARGEKQLEDKK